MSMRWISGGRTICIREMISAASVLSDPYGGLRNPYQYKSSGSVVVPEINTGRPGVAAFPETRTLDAPQIKTSSATDRKKTNAQLCYARVTKKHHQRQAGQPGGVVFVSKSFSEYDGTGIYRRSVIFGLDAVNLELSLSAKLYTRDAASPLDDWRLVNTLREWTPDGVLLGLHREIVDEDTLNVCVHGHCMATNVFDKENVFPMDTCFLCMVAELSDQQDQPHYTFKYVPCTSRAFADHNIHDTHLSRRKHPIHDLVGKVVGAWKIGRIVDSALVDQPDERSIALSVSVEWVGWRSLKEQYPWCGIAETWINYDITSPYPYSFCQVFNWPSVVTKDGVIEEPTVPERSKYEVVLDKHVAANDERRCRSQTTSQDTPASALDGRSNTAPPRSSAANEQSNNEDLTGANETPLPLVPEQERAANEQSNNENLPGANETPLPLVPEQERAANEQSNNENLPGANETPPACPRTRARANEQSNNENSPRTTRSKRLACGANETPLPLVPEQERAANEQSNNAPGTSRGTKRTVAFLDDATTSTVDDELLRQAETAALDIVSQTGRDYETLVALLNDRNTSFLTKEQRAWYNELKKNVTAFKIKFARVVYAYENATYKKQSPIIINFMRLCAALQKFQTQNPALDAGKDKVMPF